MEHEFDPRDLEPALGMSEEGRRWRLGPVLIAVVALAGFGAIVWYAYNSGKHTVGPGGTPLIKADGSPTKVKPDDPGGLDVKNQDTQVLNDLANGKLPNGQPATGVERMLPAPEVPLPPPAATTPGNVPPPIGAKPPSTAGNQLPLPAATPRNPAVASNTAPPVAQSPSTATPSAPIALAPAQTQPQPAQTQVAVAPPPAAVKPPKPAPTQPVAAAPPTAAAPAAVAPAAGGAFKVQLAALRSQDDANAAWAKLQKTYPELAALHVTVVQVNIPDKGIYFRVQAGPFADGASAGQLCDQLKAKQQGCIVVHP
jgi:cell division septation protein DedD